MLGTDVVTDALKTIFLAVRDLIRYDKDLDLAFGFANVRITNKSLATTFRDGLAKEVAAPAFEQQMIRQKSPVSTLWRTSYGDTWAKSTLGSLVKKPNKDVAATLDEKTQALKIMSLDLSSAGRFRK